MAVAGIKSKIERGKDAFETLLNEGEDKLQSVADKYQISIITLKSDMRNYMKRTYDPKPTDDQIIDYQKYFYQKQQNAYINMKNPEAIENCRKSFLAFLESGDNSSELTDLAVELNVSSAKIIITNAHKYAQRTVDPKPTAEELATYKAVCLERHESDKDNNQTYFVPVVRLLEMSSKNVGDYLKAVIDGRHSRENILERINLYIKKYPEKAGQINKLNQLKNYFDKYEEYIETQKRKNSKLKYNNAKIVIYKPKVQEIIETYIIDSSKMLDSLLGQYEITKENFDKYLALFSSGTPKEQLLYNTYTKKLETEIQDITNYIQLMNEYFENGIVKNGQTATFNILDYYRYINIKPDVFLSKARKALLKKHLIRREYENVEKFLIANGTNNPLLLEDELLKFHHSINNQEVDEQTKIEIIEELRKQGLPLYLNVYYAALDEYIKGYFVFENHNVNKTL